MNWTAWFIIAGDVFLFLATAAVLHYWARSRRRRKPFADNLRLLRVAGEAQLDWLARFDENFPLILVIAALAPVGAGSILASLALHLHGWALPAGLLVAVAGFFLTFYLAIRWTLRRMEEYGNRRLGWFGERLVAECLEPLKAAGWHVFHDVPARGATGKFNIDHAAVGPGGVFVIETKTRRKGGARPGRKDYAVVFDGRQLVWPWGGDRHGLDQAADNARWLQDWLRKTTGETVEVAAVLTFPGWLVEEQARGPVRVVNPKLLPGTLAGRGTAVLTARQIDLCARQLEQICRDVEY